MSLFHYGKMIFSKLKFFRNIFFSKFYTIFSRNSNSLELKALRLLTHFLHSFQLFAFVRAQSFLLKKQQIRNYNNLKFTSAQIQNLTLSEKIFLNWEFNSSTNRKAKGMNKKRVKYTVKKCSNKTKKNSYFSRNNYFFIQLFTYLLFFLAIYSFSAIFKLFTYFTSNIY